MRRAGWMLVGLCGWLAAGCYPDAGDESSLARLALPLEELGVQPSQRSLERWLAWAGLGFEGPAFDMSEPDADFALDIRLLDSTGLVQLPFAGTGVSLERIGGQESLVVDLTLSACAGCSFELALFWRDPASAGAPVLVFDGASETFSASQPGAAPVEVQAQVIEKDSGRILCVGGASPLEDLAGAWVAARDERANVRLPHVVLEPLADPPALLEAVPCERSLVLELDPLADGRFYSPFGSARLQAADEDLFVELP